MNTQQNDGGPAFPIPINQGESWNHETNSNGMSLRDWFAANEKVEQPDEFDIPLLESLAGPRPDGNCPLEWFAWTNKWKAKVRFARADAMIQARHEPNK